MGDEEVRLRKLVAAEIARFESESAKPSADIDLIWPFSGPGTFLSPLKGHEEPWMAWMDAHRLQRAILLGYEVTALRIGKPVQEVTKADIAEAGPILFYNGIPVEMEAFLAVASLTNFPIPQGKIVTASDVVRPETGVKVSICNSRDEVLAYPRER